MLETKARRSVTDHAKPPFRVQIKPHQPGPAVHSKAARQAPTDFRALSSVAVGLRSGGLAPVTPGQVLQLQSIVGNRAVAAALQREHTEHQVIALQRVPIAGTLRTAAMLRTTSFLNKEGKNEKLLPVGTTVVYDPDLPARYWSFKMDGTPNPERGPGPYLAPRVDSWYAVVEINNKLTKKAFLHQYACIDVIPLPFEESVTAGASGGISKRVGERNFETETIKELEAGAAKAEYMAGTSPESFTPELSEDTSNRGMIGGMEGEAEALAGAGAEEVGLGDLASGPAGAAGAAGAAAATGATEAVRTAGAATGATEVTRATGADAEGFKNHMTDMHKWTGKAAEAASPATRPAMDFIGHLADGMLALLDKVPYKKLATLLLSAISRYNNYRSLKQTAASAEEAAKKADSTPEQRSLYTAATYGREKVRRSFYSTLHNFIAELVTVVFHLITAFSGGTSAIATEAVALASKMTVHVKKAIEGAKALYKMVRGTRGKNREANATALLETALTENPPTTPSPTLTLLRELNALPAGTMDKVREAKAALNDPSTKASKGLPDKIRSIINLMVRPKDDAAMLAKLRLMMGTDGAGKAGLVKAIAEKLKSTAA